MDTASRNQLCPTAESALIEVFRHSRPGLVLMTRIVVAVSLVEKSKKLIEKSKERRDGLQSVRSFRIGGN